MGGPAGWLKELTKRSAMISPGAPKTRYSVEREFWKEITHSVRPHQEQAAARRSQSRRSGPTISGHSRWRLCPAPSTTTKLPCG